MSIATRLILVFDADSGVKAMLADVVKKAFGREDCALCEITYGPLGKRLAWQACESRLGMPVRDLHRDELPAAWGLERAHLPCVLVQDGEAKPEMLLTKAQIAACTNGSVEEFEQRLREALHTRAG